MALIRENFEKLLLVKNTAGERRVGVRNDSINRRRKKIIHRNFWTYRLTAARYELK
jgi:hypothetical protein